MTTLPLTPLRIGTQFKEAFSSRSLKSSGSAPGLLSQAVSNLNVASQRLLSLTQILPADAQPKEVSAINVLQANVSKISTLQTSVRQFVTNTLPQLKQAQTDLNKGKNVEQIASIILQSTASAVALKQGIDVTSGHITATKKQIIDLSISLAPIQARLNNKRVELDRNIQVQQQDAATRRARADILYKMLGSMAGYMDIKGIESKINDLLAEASRLRNQLADLTTLQQSVEAMIADFSDIITKLSNVSNAVLFIASDNSNVIADLKHTQGGQAKAKVFLQAAISQLQTLLIDAS